MVRTLPSLITRNATGVTDTPAPLPPPNSSLVVFAPKSDPPEANPKVTFDTGRIMAPSTVMGSPMMVLEPTISRILSNVTPIRPSSGRSAIPYTS